jgi:Cys-tRNA(Pro) deacylase
MSSGIVKIFFIINVLLSGQSCLSDRDPASLFSNAHGPCQTIIAVRPPAAVHPQDSAGIILDDVISKGAPMARVEYPVTPAVRLLRDRKIPFTPYLYEFQPHGGTRHAAASLNFAEHAIIKTLVMEKDVRQPLIVLMHGDCEVSTKQLARQISAKRIFPCDIASAEKHTGFQVGGISPFGTRSQMPVYVEASILDLTMIYINGGKRGFLVGINPQDLQNALNPLPVNVAVDCS